MRSRVVLFACVVSALAACSSGDTTTTPTVDAGTDVPSTIDVPDVPVTPDTPDVPVTPDVPTDTGPARCTSDSDCASDPGGPACDTTSGRCVACTTASDRCPAGQYCVAATNTCAAGCRDDASCSTSAGDGGATTRRCDTTTRACVDCLSDEHCPAGMLCVGNTCVTGCNASRPCPGTQSCCGGACVDAQSNTAHCGACDQRCSVTNGAAACMNGTCSVAMCTAPFADCDVSAANGCETDTSRSTEHCGACGTACAPRPNATASCTAGACAWACDTGFADCDSDPANGCEVDTRASVNHCGACGTVCALPNATATCAASRCVVATCATGFADCDGVGSNGCETDTRITVSHCGACDNACASAPNAVPACAVGACALTCTAGFADCDGAMGNGCETDTRVSANHCGGCGRACALPNATSSTCAASACAVATCAAGFGDCDGMAPNGCETDTRVAELHCGTCGRACIAGQACVAGACEALASCAAIHARFPALPSGTYPIDIDGAGAMESFQVYCDMTTDGGGWTMVYKLSSGVAGEPSDLWNSAGVNEGVVSALNTARSTVHYASRILARWNSGFTVAQARLALYEGGAERAFMRFDASGTNRTNWFTRARTQAATWTDLAAEGQNFFQIEGRGNYGRHWFINRNYGGCPADTGWLVVNGSSETTCDWSLREPAVSMMYARGTVTRNWNDYSNVGLADAMIVYVR